MKGYKVSTTSIAAKATEEAKEMFLYGKITATNAKIKAIQKFKGRIFAKTFL